MACKCGSNRIADVSGKCGDYVNISVGNADRNGDGVPRDMNIGGGDYIKFKYCLDCGTIQGNFPLPVTEMEESYVENNENEEGKYF